MFATESFTGDILVSLKPPGQRRSMEELFDVLREQLAQEMPELETVEFVPLVQDQINDLSGVKSPVEVKIFGPDLAMLRDLAEQVGKILEQWEKEKKVADVNTNVLLGNPDIVIRPDSVQTARVGLSAPGRGNATQRGPIRPGGQHAAAARSPDEHPRALSRLGPIRS